MSVNSLGESAVLALEFAPIATALLLLFTLLAMPLGGCVRPPEVGQSALLGEVASPGDVEPLPVALAEPPSAPAREGLIYEIYVRSFQDSDGDGIGDLRGVQRHLDYLAGLGVGTLWLLPVFPAFGPAGYDVTDFNRIRDEYGTAADLADLVAEAHARGMRVILDVPLNQVHRTHPWFEALGVHPERFVLQARAPDGERWFPAGSPQSAYYGCFGADLPDLNWKDPGVRAAMFDVFRGWLAAGADGFRLDAVVMLVEEHGDTEGTAASHAVVADLYGAVKAADPDAYVLAEASEHDVDRSVSWLGTAGAPESDAVLDFPRYEAFFEAVEADPEALVGVVEAQGPAARSMAVFLASHDTDRLATVLPDPRERRALRVVQFLLPGIPVVDYGDELDQANDAADTGEDLAMRGPMAWDDSNEGGFSASTAWFSADPAYATVNVEAENRDPGSMLALIRSLAAVRRAAGEGVVFEDVGPAPVLAFTRGVGPNSVRVEVNLSGRELAGPWDLQPWAFRIEGASALPG